MALTIILLIVNAKMDVKKMTKKEIDKMELFEMYIADDKSAEECAEHFGISRRTLFRRLKTFDLENIKQSIYPYSYRTLTVKKGYGDKLSQNDTFLLKAFNDWKIPNSIEKARIEAERVKTPEEIEQRLINKEMQGWESKQAKIATEIVKNKDTNPTAYERQVELAQKLDMKNIFDLEWEEACRLWWDFWTNTERSLAIELDNLLGEKYPEGIRLMVRNPELFNEEVEKITHREDGWLDEFEEAKIK